MKHKTDAELIELLRKGSHEAFTEIFDKYYTLIYHFARGRLNYNKEEAKDLVHDVFTKLWDKRESINIMPDKLPNLLVTSVKNRINDSHKHHLVEQKYLNYFEYYLTRSSIEETDHLATTSELIERINKAIATLPEKMRTVFQLIKFSDMSRKQIADHLGLPENTVKTWIQRAMARLKKEINRGE